MRRINSIIVIILGILLLTCTVTNAQTLQVALSPDKSKVDRNAIEGMATILFESSVEDLNIVCTEENPDEPIVKVTDNLWYIRINVKKDIDSDGICYRNFLLRSPASAEYYLSTELISPKQVLYYTISLPNELEPKYLEEKSKRLAETAMAILKKGDSYKSRTIALNALDYYYSIEAEAALWQSSQQNTAILLGHTEDVRSVAFSPDNKFIVSASWDNTVRLWNVATGQCLFVFEGHNNPVWDVAFSPDGERIVSASKEGDVRIWDVTNGKCLNVLEQYPIGSVSFSPDGKSIAVSASEIGYYGFIEILDSKSGQSVLTIKGHNEPTTSVAFSPNGKLIASASLDKTIRIWDVSTGQCMDTLEGHTFWVYSVEYSPNGELIASASGDNTIRIWDAITGQCVRILKGHTMSVNSAFFSPNGKFVVSASSDNTIRIWDVYTGRCLKIMEGHNNTVHDVIFSSDGKKIVSASRDKTVRIWDFILDNSELTLVGHTGSVNSATVSSNGSYIVSASQDSTIRIWDFPTGHCIRTLARLPHSVETVSFSPDDKRIVSTSLDGIRVWNRNTGKCIQTMGEGQVIGSARFSSDGEIIISSSMSIGGWDINVWDADSGKKMRTEDSFETNDSTIIGKRSSLFVMSNGVFVRRVATGECRKINTQERIEKAILSPDEKELITALSDNTIRIWNIDTGSCVRVLDGHTSGITCIIFSPDGKRIVSASRDKTICVWDYATGLCMMSLFGHTGRINSIAFHPSEDYLISSSNDKTIKIWNLSLEKLKHQTRERFKCSLTDERINVIE